MGKKEIKKFGLLKANVTDLRNNGESPEAIKGAMETLPSMFDMEPHSPKRLNKLLTDENRDHLMDYLDQHWNEIDWNELRPIVEKDEVLSLRYRKFINE